MAAIARRGFLAGCAALGISVAAAATLPAQAPKDQLTDFGAVGDGTYDPATGRMTGTDNTEAINAALESGRPIRIPPGYFYYSGLLHASMEGSGLIGAGSQQSYLITDHSRDWHIGVQQGTKNTQWVGFSMIGPHINDGHDYNRALLIGMDDSLRTNAHQAWDASGTWIDDFATYGYCVGLHVSLADNVRFGTIQVFEAGDSRAEPGSYGITCSGSNLRGALLRSVNTTTRARHAVYYNGPANDCFVDVVEATGFDGPAVQNRCKAGGGQRNGFGQGHFELCNLNQGPEPVEALRGVVNFVCADDVVVEGAGGAHIGDYTAVSCGGFPGPSLRFMPDSRCGAVKISGHSGDFSVQPFGSHVYYSDRVELPMLVFVGDFTAPGMRRF